MSSEITTGIATSWRLWGAIWMFGALTGAAAFSRWSVPCPGTCAGASPPALATHAGSQPSAPTPGATHTQSPAAEPTEDDRPKYGVCDCSTAARDGVGLAEQRALRLACESYSDQECRYPFELFASIGRGRQRAVVVKRSTGDCGGCGAMVVASVFRDGQIESKGLLGSYGRFGNGPDRVGWVDVAGEPALQLEYSLAMGGYASTHREYFLLDADRITRGLSLETEYSNEAVLGSTWEEYFAWHARLRHHPNGDIEVKYVVSGHGVARPATLSPFRIPFDRAHRRWLYQPPEIQVGDPD